MSFSVGLKKETNFPLESSVKFSRGRGRPRSVYARSCKIAELHCGLCKNLIVKHRLYFHKYMFCQYGKKPESSIIFFTSTAV